jgi:hypothetical protein
MKAKTSFSEAPKAKILEAPKAEALETPKAEVLETPKAEALEAEVLEAEVIRGVRMKMKMRDRNAGEPGVESSK